MTSIDLKWTEKGRQLNASAPLAHAFAAAGSRSDTAEVYRMALAPFSADERSKIVDHVCKADAALTPQRTPRYPGV